MKKLILMLTLVAGMSASTFAQSEVKTPQTRAAHITRVLQKKLNLTADQATQVNSIMLVRANRIDSLRSIAADANNRIAKRSMKRIMASTDEDLGFVLNPDQQKAYYNWKAERKERKQAKRNGTETMSANITPQHES